MNMVSPGGSSRVLRSVFEAASFIASAPEMMKTRVRLSDVLMEDSRRISRMLLILMTFALGICIRWYGSAPLSRSCSCTVRTSPSVSLAMGSSSSFSWDPRGSGMIR